VASAAKIPHPWGERGALGCWAPFGVRVEVPAGLLLVGAKVPPVNRVRTGIADHGPRVFAFRGFSLGLFRSWFRTALGARCDLALATPDLDAT
jgi:hypothetical protein